MRQSLQLTRESEAVPELVIDLDQEHPINCNSSVSVCHIVARAQVSREYG